MYRLVAWTGYPLWSTLLLLRIVRTMTMAEFVVLSRYLVVGSFLKRVQLVSRLYLEVWLIDARAYHCCLFNERDSLATCPFPRFRDIMRRLAYISLLSLAIRSLIYDRSHYRCHSHGNNGLDHNHFSFDKVGDISISLLFHKASFNPRVLLFVTAEDLPNLHPLLMWSHWEETNCSNLSAQQT